MALAPLRRNESYATRAEWRRTILKILIEPFESREEALAADEHRTMVRWYAKTHLPKTR